MKVLMVCLGNICRSPLAEGILQHKIEMHNLAGWEVSSAGIGGWHAGDSPDKRSVRVALENGIDISGQRARVFENRDFADYDLILAMDSENYAALLSRASSVADREKVQLIMNFSRPDMNTAVPDPYYDGRFQLVFEMLEEACLALVRQKK
jgi:protein-tyrosine phosphatase